MNRSLNRPPGPPLRLDEAAAPAALLAVLGAAAAALGVVRVAAGAAAPPGLAVPGFGAPLARAALASAAAGSLDPLIGPGGSRPLFWAVVGIVGAVGLAAAGAVTWWAAGRWARVGDPARSLARRRDYADMSGRGARRRAVQLRPSLARREVDDRDLGLRLGRVGELNPAQLVASEEDVLLMIAGPRSNKTSAVVVPAALSAPGPVIVTSNKVDVYTLTVGLRAAAGRVFTLDPQHIAGAEQTWWWNPLAGIREMADVAHLTSHFIQTVSGERADPYFTRGAERLLGQLVLAAALATPQRSLRDVARWLATRSTEPVQLLRAAGQDEVAVALQGTIESPPDQRGGLYETALTAISCLESEAVARYVTPPATWQRPPRVNRVEEFDPWRFVVGYDHDFTTGQRVPHDTLYLLTREGAGTGAPIVAALVDHVLRTAAAAATASGGRVDPPIRAVLDEAANICPIRNLPDLYSYFGSMSIQVLTFLQSYQQGVAIWGKAGMDKLWSAATVKLIGAGVHDPSTCEDISRLLGEHDVPTWSSQSGRGGGSTSMSTRRERIMSAADVAALPKTSAVLIAAGRRAGLLTLQPWYAEPDADTISGPAAEAAEQVRQAAIAHLGPTNPLAQMLAHTTTGGRP